MDLSTTERRNKALLADCRVLIDDMKNVHELASKSKFYRVVHANITFIKQVVYMFVVLVNLAVLVSPDELRQPYKILFGCESKDRIDSLYLGSYCTVPSRLQLPLFCLSILSLLNFLLYFVIVFYLSWTEIPILFKRTKVRSDALLNDPNVSPTDYLDFNAFFGPFVYAIFASAFCFLHWANYEPNLSLYWLLGTILILWVAKCFRDFVVVVSEEQLLLLK